MRVFQKGLLNMELKEKFILVQNDFEGAGFYCVG